MKIDDDDSDADYDADDDFEEFPLVAPIHRSLGIDPHHSYPQHLPLLLVKFGCIGCLRGDVGVQSKLVPGQLDPRARLSGAQFAENLWYTIGLLEN